MPRRKKSPLEKFFSWNRHKRRQGATNIDLNTDFARMKSERIDVGNVEYTFGSASSVEEHIENLRKEFHGQTELEFYHAKLNVLLRREYQVKETYAKFSELWNAEGEYLKAALNTRWLISAADSVIDHDSSAESRSQAFSAVCLVNTIKLYETEAYVKGTSEVPVDEEKAAATRETRLPLFDGTSGFAYGTDDTLRNMRWRMDELTSSGTIGGMILDEVFARLQLHPTAYKRFKEMHYREKTSWW